MYKLETRNEVLSSGPSTNSSDWIILQLTLTQKKKLYETTFSIDIFLSAMIGLQRNETALVFL